MFVLKSGIANNLYSFGIANKLCKVLSKNNVIKNQTAALTRACFRDEIEVPNIEPFNYQKKPYTFLMWLLDTNQDRVHKHCKLLVVDGQIGAGKAKVAQELAKAFDFLYLPQPTFDLLYVTPWGFDLRTLDSKLPKDIQTWDIERFLQNPQDINNAAMQLYMYFLRQQVYKKALIHMFLTGQGVVTVRSPWSDVAFAKAMQRNNYISKPALDSILKSYKGSLHNYFPPHLIINLDTPVECAIKNIKECGAPYEKNSSVLNAKYLTDFADSLEQDCYKKLEPLSLQLHYDMTKDVDILDIVDDIEKLNFDHYTSHDMLSDWRYLYGESFGYALYYHTRIMTTMEDMNSYTGVPELMVSPDSMEIWDELMEELPEARYAPGYNTLKGDKNTFWATRLPIPLPYNNEDHVGPLIKKYREKEAKLKWYEKRNLLNVRRLLLSIVRPGN